MYRPVPTNIEVKFEGGNMITDTDLQGRITFANRIFIHMSGYEREELVGKPHSIIRHPDMPKSCFEEMWQTIRQGEVWEGYIKNLRKDGAYYWAIVRVAPKYDTIGNLCGYIALRKPPETSALQEVTQQYALLHADEAS